MDALVMCGGRGTRLEADVEKPLLSVSGTPMVGRVLDALDGSRIDGVHAVVSPHVPETASHLENADVRLVETAGEGYVADLGEALGRVTPPVLTVVADLPLLAPEHVDRALDEHAEAGGSLTVCVPTALKEALRVSAETTLAHGGRPLAPTGLNVVGRGDDETVTVRWDARLAVNVNYADDVRVAEALADGPDEGEGVADGGP